MIDPAQDERAIREVVDAWMEASRRGDVEAVLDLMTDDAIFMTAGREPFGKEEFRASFEGMKGLKMDGRSDIQELEVVGDWAWVRNSLEITMTKSGSDPVHRAGYTLTILRKDADSRWRLHRDANLVS
jgi:uncharacterized protein (TIGR02246 family)